MSDAILLPDDHIETPVLREYAPGHVCGVIGAYKGATMRYLFQHGASYVVGVEPQPWARNLAVKNLIDQGPHNWEIDCLALVPWETDPGSLTTLYNVSTDGANIQGVRRWLNERDFMDVTAMNVVKWCNQYDPFDFMVVNCEGAEYMLLPWLATHTRVLLVQFHGPPMPMAMVDYVDRFENVENIGKGWYLYR